MAAPEDTIVEHQIIDPEKVAGDASLELKREVVRLWPFSYADPDHFASSVGVKLELVEISVVPKREDDQVMEAKMVAEIDVVPGVFFGNPTPLGVTRLTRVYTRNAQPVRFHAWRMYRIPDRPVSLNVPDILEESDPVIEGARAHRMSRLRFIMEGNRARRWFHNPLQFSFWVHQWRTSPCRHSMAEMNADPLTAVTDCGW